MAAKKKAPAKRPAAKQAPAKVPAQPQQKPAADPAATSAQDQATATASSAADNTQAADNPPPKDPNAEALEVMTRSAAGFFRCGWKWGRQARIVALADFTPEQIEQLEKEPELIVRRCKLGD